MKHILNYGGGVNSTALYFVARERGMLIDEVIFADTGSEMPATYMTVKKMKEIVEADGIHFQILKSIHGNIYDYYFKHKAVPSRQRRDCTTKFKIRSIRNYLRRKYGKDETFINYIGISYEELHRMKDSDVKYCINNYPLVDARVDREACIKINEDHNFPNICKSGCFFCPFTRKQGWLDLMKNYPDLYEQAVRLEENCPNKKTQLASKPLRAFRQFKGQKKLEEFEPTCDVAGGCFL